MYTLEECEKLWDEAGKHGAAPERMTRTRRWFPYYSYLASTMKDVPYSLPEQPNCASAALSPPRGYRIARGPCISSLSRMGSQCRSSA